MTASIEEREVLELGYVADSIQRIHSGVPPAENL